MQLINPAMLYLAAAAVIPPIIHLLSRRRVEIVRFPAVRFLRRTARTSLTRTKLKYLLLMLLRMGLICLLALILARPVVGGAGGRRGAPQSAALTSAVVILDDSLSMNYRRGGASWFDRARNHALEIIGQLPTDAEAAITTSSNPAMQFTQDVNELRNRLTAIRPTLGANSCWQAIDRAGTELRDRTSRASVIYLLTDMTRSAWLGLDRRAGTGSGSSPALDLGGTVALEIVVASEPGVSNLAVTSVRHRGEPLVQGALLSLEAELLCVGREAEAVVQFEFDGRLISRRTVRLAANGTEKLFLKAPISTPGHHWGRVSLLNTDALPHDNARVFSFEAAGEVSVLFVDELAGADGSAAPRRGQRPRSYFVRTALSPWERSGRGIFSINAIKPKQLETERLTEYDLVALIDCPGPTESVWGRLADFVAGGGGLLVSCGPGMRAEGYAGEQARGLLPVFPGEVVNAPGGSSGPFRMRVVRPQHPLLASFAEAGVDVGRVKLRKCRRLRLAETAEEVLSFGPGLPALVLGRAGGRIAVFAGGCGTEWSDFPKQPEFVPFCQELVLYLTDTGGGQLSSFMVGQHVPIRLESTSLPTVVVVMPPGSQEGVRLMPGTTPGRRLFWKTRVPGYYRVAFSRRDRQWSGGFGVNAAAVESDLRMASESKVRAAIKAGRLGFHTGTSSLPSPGAAGGMAGWAGLELTPYLVLLALAACVAEVFLANRIYRASDTPAEPQSQAERRT